MNDTATTRGPSEHISLSNARTLLPEDRVLVRALLIASRFDLRTWSEGETPRVRRSAG